MSLKTTVIFNTLVFECYPECFYFEYHNSDATEHEIQLKGERHRKIEHNVVSIDKNRSKVGRDRRNRSVYNLSTR